MRRLMVILAAVLVLIAAEGCKRRPLVEIDNNVLLNITIEREIVNYEMEKDPEMMRVMFFDAETGKFASHSFLPHNGGYVSVLPGRTYDILVYNFDTETTIIGQEQSKQDIHAYTNLVPENLKSRLKSRATKDNGEMIVFEPDHLFVGRLEDVYIPLRGEGMPVFELDIHAETVVETWIVEIDRIRGAEYVGAATAVISGLAHNNEIATGERSEDEATVFFEASELTKDGKFYAKFNTFGPNHEAGAVQVLSLVVTDTGGKNRCFNMNITDKFKDNPEQYIRIVTDEIVIEKPEQTSGGGLAPIVDEWGEINTDIII